MNYCDRIKAVLYDETHENNPMVKCFIALPGKELFHFHDESGLSSRIEEVKKRGFLSKDVLILKNFHGRLFQKCPGSKNVVCCNYRLLNTCFNCVFDCTYCFLNSYLNSYGIVQIINIDDAIRDLVEQIPGNSGIMYRVGTGEFTDSLMFDEITGFAEHLIDSTRNLAHVVLEFKTKSDAVGHLTKIAYKKNAVIAWSLNTKRIIGLYEKGAAGLEERIASARMMQDAGYFVAFHFDPVIIYDDFRREYLSAIDTLFRSVDAERVAWISLGCFRYSPGFRERMAETFPWETLTLGEFFPGPDGKYRYLKQKRVEIYRALLERIRRYSGRPFVYMCMETGEVWKSVFNVEYHSSDDLESAFSVHLKEYFFKGF